MNTDTADCLTWEKTNKTHTISIDVDLSTIEWAIEYDDLAIKTILNTGLYTLLEWIKEYLDNQSKTKKRQKKTKKVLSMLLDHLQGKRSVITTQDWIHSQIIHLVKEDESAEWKDKWFANLIIYTKDAPNWERLITFIKDDFKDKEFDPIKAMKEAIKKYNKSH